MKLKVQFSFTLIELLIVTAILGILISLLQPSLNNFVKQSEKQVCLNNLRQISGMANLYEDDHDGAFYQIWHHNPWNDGWHAWGYIMASEGYVDLESNEAMLYCPSTDKENRQTWWTKFFTYGINHLSHHRNQQTDAREVIRNNDGSDSDLIYMNRLSHPSEYMFMIDTKTSGAVARGKAMIANWDATWNGRVWQIHDPGMGANSLYGDGHASFDSPETYHELFGKNLGFAYEKLESW